MRMVMLYIQNLVHWIVSQYIRSFHRSPHYVTFYFEGEHPHITQPRSMFFLMHLLNPPKMSINEFSKACTLLKRDSSIKGIILHLRTLQLPLGNLDAIRNCLLDFRKSGKRVIVWSTAYDESRYYIASACDKILLVPGGSIMPLGHQRNFLFLKDALHKIGIDAQFVPISPYKSAADTFCRTDFSEKSKEMQQWLFDSTYSHYVKKIAEGRNIDVETLSTFIDQTPCTDLNAKERGLIDEILNEEELANYLSTPTESVNIQPWVICKPFIQKDIPEFHEKYIALISIEGSIIEGSNRKPMFGSYALPFPFGLSKCAGDKSIVATIRKIEKDPNVAALIVYIDSGGGSAAASETMRSALEKIAKKIPLIAIMGPTAASGGYWVATAAQKIYAYPNTITGSIGVLTGKFIMKGLFNTLLFHKEVISSGKHTRMYSPDSPFTEEQLIMVKEQIKRVYDLFIDRVSKSRHLDAKAIDDIGQGRVWTGSQALEKGLIDGIGGFDQALSEVYKLAKVKPFAPVYSVHPPRKPLSSTLSSEHLAYRYIRFLLKGEQTTSALCVCPYVEN